MRDNTQNRGALASARATVSAFEAQYGLSSEDMLACAQGDLRLKDIDPFELMDWHFALEEIKAFSEVLDSLFGNAEDAEPASFSLFQHRYIHSAGSDLKNNPDSELMLVA